MIRTIALREPTDIPCGERIIRLERDGGLSFGSGREGDRLGIDPSTSTHAVVWSAQDWCCLLGLQSRDLVVIRPSEEKMVVAGQLDRLDLGGGYDPGGLHRVEIRELADGDILVEHELGLARVSATGIVWQRRHEDITARVTEIFDGVAWLAGETEHFGYDLEHGDPRFATEA